MSRKLFLAAVTGAFSLLNLAVPSTASAAIIVTNVQVPYYQGITLTSTASSPAGLFGGVGNNEVVGIAGQIILTTNIGLLGVWCVDLFRDISLGGNYTYTVGALTTDSATPPVGPNALTPTQINKIGALAAYGNFLMATSPSHAKSAAIQAAIWNVEYNTTATGTPAFQSELANIFALLNSNALSNPGGNQLFSSQNSQGVYIAQGLYVPNNPPDKVPEPSTLAMIAFGLLSLFGAGLTRRRADA